MKILVVSGFLGAGKTTFIKEFSRKTGRLFCILENEFGAVNVDEAVLREENDTMKIYELTSGCICCSTKGEFASTCLTIANTINPDYLIVEPTGVGSLTNIRNNLNRISYSRIEILNPICIVDGLAVLNGTTDFNGIFLDQIEQSRYVFLSKMESLSNKEKDFVYQRILKIAKGNTSIIKEDYKSLPVAFFLAMLEGRNEKEKPSTSKKMVKMESVSFVSLTIPNVVFLVNLLDEISRGRYGNIRRAKGILSSPFGMLQFDYVDSLYSIREFEESESKAVFIGSSVDIPALEKRLGQAAILDDDDD